MNQQSRRFTKSTIAITVKHNPKYEHLMHISHFIKHNPLISMPSLEDIDLLS